MLRLYGSRKEADMERNSFVFYADWWNVLCGLTDRKRLKCFDAVCRYVFNGEEPKDEEIKAITGLMRSAIDRDNEKWIAKSKARRNAINKRWHPDKSDTNTSNGNTEDAKTFFVSDCNTKNTNVSFVSDCNTKHSVNVNGNVNVNVNDKERDKERDTVVSPKKARLSLPKSPSSAKTLEERQEKFKNEIGQFVNKYGKDTCNSFYNYWSEPEQGKEKPRMRKELQKTWETSKRLAQWKCREKGGYK